jgi:hypothetical protein
MHHSRTKLLSSLACLLLPALGFAQEETIPIFNLDDYYAEPKMNLSVGFRALTGPKLAFIGSTGVTSTLSSVQTSGDQNATGIGRDYHDGYIGLDTRKDANGNALTDGKTNAWYYADARQVLDTGYLAFHTYSAAITDNNSREKDLGNSYGTELVVSRDMGKIGSRIQWKIFAGFSINGINNGLRDNVLATVTTQTDKYFMNGQTVPSAPYLAPSTITNDDGSITDTTVLIGQKPDSRTSSTKTDNVSVSNYWKLRGSYLTFRAGPTLTFSFGEKFKFTVSGGPAMVYVGTNYSLEQTLLPDTSDPISSTINDLDDDMLTGYYVDANMEYILTDRAGLYVGAFFQGSGEYEQDLTAEGSSYSTKLDLSSLKGLRAGLNYRF